MFQELSASQEPFDDVYLDNLARSIQHPDGERSRKTRKLNEGYFLTFFIQP